MDGDLGWALAALGVSAHDSPEAVRKAYRERLFARHPDTSGSDGREVRELIEAYRVLSVGGPAGEAPASGSPPGTEVPQAHLADPPVPGGAAGSADPGEVWLVDSDTIALACPAEDAYLRLLEVAHRLGDVTYVDRACGLLEALLRTRDGTTLSLVMTLQGRATGHTEAFLTVEPLDIVRGPLPAIADLTELVASYLR